MKTDLEQKLKSMNYFDMNSSFIDNLNYILIQNKNHSSDMIDSFLKNYYLHELFNSENIYSSEKPYNHQVSVDQFKDKKIFGYFDKYILKNSKLFKFSIEPYLDEDIDYEDIGLFDDIVSSEFNPILEFCSNSKFTEKIRLSAINWIFTEVIINGFRSYIPKRLKEKTGFSYQKLLKEISPNVKEDIFMKRYNPTNKDTQIIESAINYDIPSFRKKHFLEQYDILEMNISDFNPIVLAKNSEDELEIFVRFKGLPSAEQHEQIVNRFMNYSTTRKKIEEKRSKNKENGAIKIPSFTGGGKLALLECIRGTRESDSYFDYAIGKSPLERTIFRLSNKSLKSKTINY